jgi:DNA-3-methyladenine glycosylase I
VINKAKQARELVAREGSVAAFVWRFPPAAHQLAKPQTVSTSEASIALSAALKNQGWRFVGPTTVYAFMQAMGLVDDHVEECVIRADVKRRRRIFKRSDR